MLICVFILILPFLTVFTIQAQIVDVKKTQVWGPGLKPDIIVLPARYFYIYAVDTNGNRFKQPTENKFDVRINGVSLNGGCRSTVQLIDRGDGSFIVRYNIPEWCDQVRIEVLYNNSHVAQSPYNVPNKVYSANCYCPQELNTWLLQNRCPSINDEKQMQWDLHSFKRVNLSVIRHNLIRRYNIPNSISLCHYVVKDQQIWRKCYGKYTGFKMFMDSTLAALLKVVRLPDIEFFLNLGDWPLSRKGGQQRISGPYPIFSWCGSNDSHDITLPTYDITESTVENMGRVTLDMLSVQQIKYSWDIKEEKAFFRGRDSRRERLMLIDLAKKYPDYINASITNFFFFRDEEEKYGPRMPHISFTEFFKYKYQLNIDGAVAAYRLPYLLAGGSLVFKQDSNYYEHFYSKLIPYKHYVPVKRDLSNLIVQLDWARKNDVHAREIVNAARDFVENNLSPQHIYCYHITLFQEWSERLISAVDILPGMEKYKQTLKCSCKEPPVRDEL